MKRVRLTLCGVAVGLVLSAVLTWQGMQPATAQVPSIYSIPQMYRVTLGADQSLTAVSGFCAAERGNNLRAGRSRVRCQWGDMEYRLGGNGIDPAD